MVDLAPDCHNAPHYEPDMCPPRRVGKP